MEQDTNEFHAQHKERQRQATYDHIDSFEGRFPEIFPKSKKALKVEKKNDPVAKDAEKIDQEAGNGKMLIVKKPLTPLRMYDYGAITLKPISTLSINPHLRDGVTATETFCSSPFGGLPPTVIEPHLLRPRLPTEAFFPKVSIVDVPPLKRHFSFDTLLDRRLGPWENLQKNVRPNRAQTMRHNSRALMNAQIEFDDQMQEQFRWDGKHGYGWKDRTTDHTEWLRKFARVDDQKEWLTKINRSSWTADQARIFQIVDVLFEATQRRKCSSRVVFGAFDKDNNQTVDPHEFIEGMKNLGLANVPGKIQMSRDDILILMQCLDSNYDGTLSFEELDSIMLAVGVARKQIEIEKKRENLRGRVQKPSSGSAGKKKK